MKKIILLVLITIALAGCNQKVNALTLEEAQEIALKEVAGKVLKAKEDKEDGVSYYDFTIVTDTEKYEVEIDANTGKILKMEKDDDYTGIDSNLGNGTVTPVEPTETLITIEQAQQIALERVGGGYLTKSELDYDDGIKKYEIEIKNGNKEYELEIKADTGEIIKYEEDND